MGSCTYVQAHANNEAMRMSRARSIKSHNSGFSSLMNTVTKNELQSW